MKNASCCGTTKQSTFSHGSEKLESGSGAKQWIVTGEILGLDVDIEPGDNGPTPARTMDSRRDSPLQCVAMFLFRMIMTENEILAPRMKIENKTMYSTQKKQDIED